MEMTKTEKELVQHVIEAFMIHDKVKHGRSMAVLRESVKKLAEHIAEKK